jgi:hypothetical protein
LKLIPNWYASNRMHFHYVLRSNQSHFFVMLKFFVRIASIIANHSHQFYLKESPNWSALNPSHLLFFCQINYNYLLSSTFFLSRMNKGIISEGHTGARFGTLA